MKFKEFLNKINESGPFSYGHKKPRKGTVAYNAAVRQKKDKTPPIEPKDQMVGVARVVKEQSTESSINEMDKSAPQPGRDGHVSHRTYGSRDNYKLGDPEGPGVVVKPRKVTKQGLSILSRMFKNTKS